MSFKISKKFFCIYLLILLNNFSSIYGSQNVKIAFVITELIERGVQVSTYDFAHFNETLLGNESFIINFDIATDNDVRKKFMNRFPGRFFDCVSSEDMDYILSQEQIDILYRQKPGENTDNILSKVCKNAIHAYYPLDLQIHGDVYAFVSDWFTKKFPESGVPVVPLIVQVAETN